MLELLKKITGIAPSQPTTSGKMTLDKVDIKKVAIHTGIVAVAAGLTYLGTFVLNLDFGTYSVFIVPALTAGLETLQKWLRDNDVQP